MLTNEVTLQITKRKQNRRGGAHLRSCHTNIVDLLKMEEKGAAIASFDAHERWHQRNWNQPRTAYAGGSVSRLLMANSASSRRLATPTLSKIFVR